MYMSLAIVVVVLVLGWLLRSLLKKGVRKLTERTRTGLDDAVVRGLERPVVVIFVLGGLLVAALYAPLDPVATSYLFRVLSVALGLLGIYAVVVVVDAVLRWYRQEVTRRGKDVGLAVRILGLFRVTLVSVAALMALLLVLKAWEISASAVNAWLVQHGSRIGLIAVVAMAAIVAIGEFVPILVANSLAHRAGEPAEEANKRGKTLSRVLVNAAQVVVLLGTSFAALSELEIDIAPILAGVGVAGIAIGFGAQSLVKDLLAGLFIILENHYRVGDVVRIADVAGLVEDINLRRTVLRDLDGIVHIVPNGEIRVASNFTKEWSRVNLNVSVAYGEDLDRVIAVINRVGKELAADPKWAPALLTPPQALRVDNLGESGIDIKILGDTQPIRQWEVTGELRKRIKKAFDEEGIEIPWPHTKVYFGKSPSGTEVDSPTRIRGQRGDG
ncbi:MAG: mechanosensitive ion channel family protein [Chloroflexota bacterium]